MMVLKSNTLRAAVCLILLSCSLPGQAVPVNVRVITPPETPSGSTLYIAGNSTPLGDWDPGRVRLERESDSVWTFKFRVPEGAIVEFKITLGSWEREALYSEESMPGGIRFTAREDTTIILRPSKWKGME